MCVFYMSNNNLIKGCCFFPRRVCRLLGEFFAENRGSERDCVIADKYSSRERLFGFPGGFFGFGLRLLFLFFRKVREFLF